MARSLSLSAYLAVARREPLSAVDAARPRPMGELIWIHSGHRKSNAAMIRLGQRLVAMRGEGTVLLTTSRFDAPRDQLPRDVIWHELPSENPSSITEFLEYWRPDIGLWHGADMYPALLSGAKDRDIPLVMVAADQVSVPNSLARWMPDPVRATLHLFDTVFARSDEAMGRFRRAGLDDETLLRGGDVFEDCAIPSCNETDQEELSKALGGRPVWLAAYALLDELPFLLQAHSRALKRAHRLLLVLAPARHGEADEIMARCKATGWRVADWADGGFPDETTQILLADGPDEMGLWYRIAPLSMLASTLTPGRNAPNPLEAAALGSAVLYGPSVRTHLDAYSRMTKNGAARLVQDAATLAREIDHLATSHQLAGMAHAGWETISEGAEAIDQIIEIAHSHLDKSPIGDE